MSADFAAANAARGAFRAGVRPGSRLLRLGVVAAGLGWAALFILLGLGFQLQLYGDGALFSYAVAAQDVWAFHWHNISGRLFPYVFTLAPAEAYVGLTGDARGGIALYGLLHFAAPLLGLLATFRADRTPGRIIFTYACASTACLCPLVFGFPTEVWMTHALFWPLLALCHQPGGEEPLGGKEPLGGGARFGLILAGMLGLSFTHAGAFIFVLAILATLALRGGAPLRRAALAFGLAAVVFVAVRIAYPPDDYFAPVLLRAALHVFDIGLCKTRTFTILATALGAYGLGFCLFRFLERRHDAAAAAAVVAFMLAAFWLWFDTGLLAENRYYMRTLVLLAAPALGAVAGAYAAAASAVASSAATDDGARLIGRLRGLLAALAEPSALRIAGGAFALLMLVHAVETTKFITAWTRYKTAVTALATGGASDPALGDARFVSAARIGRDLNRLSWNSTTPYLSVLLAPNLSPARLVVDPKAGYFWLACATANASARAGLAVPEASRLLIRAHACLHRP